MDSQPEQNAEHAAPLAPKSASRHPSELPSQSPVQSPAKMVAEPVAERDEERGGERDSLQPHQRYQGAASVAPPSRTVWIVVLALVQGLACWFIPKDLLSALLPPAIAVPVAFYCSERELPTRPWVPSLLVALVWLPGLYSIHVADGLVTHGRVANYGIAVYWFFCFFALPFFQAWAAGGLRGMRPVELSAHMNRNITLMLIGCLALLPVCIALGFGLGNIDWNFWSSADSRMQGSRVLGPFFIFSLVVPLTFAGAINWAQVSMEKQAGARDAWPVLPFLRKTIGVISGWAALVAGFAMAGIVISRLIQGGIGSESNDDALLRLMPAAFFWTACSMSVREGRWKDKPKIFRALLTMCTLVFAVYMVWCVIEQWHMPHASSLFSEQRHPFWNWHTLSLGVLLVASLGHGVAVCLRHWPQWAAGVNMGVHVGILLLLAVTRLPVADPLRYEAASKAAWLHEHPEQTGWRHDTFKSNFGRYAREALAEHGVHGDAQQAQAEKHAALVAQFCAALTAAPRQPHDAVIPESLFQWLATTQDWDNLDDWLIPREGRLVVIQDMDRDGEAEVLLLNVLQGFGRVLRHDAAGWTQAGSMRVTEQYTLPVTVGRQRPVWDDLLINETRIPIHD